MYFPSVDVSDLDVLDAVQLGGIRFQTGQWVHDMVSKGRLVNSFDGTVLIVWFSPSETIQKFNTRFTRIVRAYRVRPQIADQLYLFGDLEKSVPLFSSSQEIASFKKGNAKRKKLPLMEQHRIWQQKKPWMESHGYYFGGSNSYPSSGCRTEGFKGRRDLFRGLSSSQC
ncbi:MAG: hypothetical protein RPU42_04145 [Candidatus Sedimenticola sp. (ex Thyasira tokunagai)]